MSFINKVLASVGVGSAQVDTKLEIEKFKAGEEIKGVVEVKGGNVEQNIDDIYLAIVTTYQKEVDDRNVTDEAVVGKYRLTKNFTIKPNETKEIPFSFELPLDLPLTIGSTKVWVQTGLDIKMGIDPSDRDYIEVIPSNMVDSVLKSFSNLGFSLKEVECKEAPLKMRRRLPFVQEFEFVPTSGEFVGKLDEIEVIFTSSFERHLELFMQIDRKAKGLGGLLSEAFDLDETYIRFTLSKEDISIIDRKLTEILKEQL